MRKIHAVALTKLRGVKPGQVVLLQLQWFPTTVQDDAVIDS